MQANEPTLVDVPTKIHKIHYGKMDYGFIVTRHVNSEKTNQYWNQCVKCIRQFYPTTPIVIIDDNSKKEYIKAYEEYSHLRLIQSEYPGRGELLPFIYLIKYHFFDNAVIIHDSVFFHKRINFEKIKLSVLPLWHFNRHIDEKENKRNNLRIAQSLQNNTKVMYQLKSIMANESFAIQWNANDSWNGCFGVQCFINYFFLQRLEATYKISNMLQWVRNRTDRCSLERIMGVLFNIECPQTRQVKSLLGDIFSYMNFGYSFDQYVESVRRNRVIRPIVKVWTGR